MPLADRLARNAYIREWKRRDRRAQGIPTKADMPHPPRLSKEEKIVSKERARVRCLKWQRKYNELNPDVRLFRAAKARAKKRGLEFSIGLSDIVIPVHCPYLGIELASTRPRGNKRRDIISLDRKDNSKGYTKDNIEVISHLANTMKNSAAPKELIDFAKAILKRYT